MNSITIPSHISTAVTIVDNKISPCDFLDWITDVTPSFRLRLPGYAYSMEYRSYRVNVAVEFVGDSKTYAFVARVYRG